MVFPIDGNNQRLVFVNEKTSSLWPVTAESTCFKESVILPIIDFTVLESVDRIRMHLLENSMIFNELLIIDSNTLQRTELTSEVTL